MNKARHKEPYIVWFSIYEISRKGKTQETEERLVVAQDQGQKQQLTAMSKVGLGLLNCIHLIKMMELYT